MAPYTREIKNIVTPVDTKDVLLSTDLVPLNEFGPARQADSGWNYKLEVKEGYVRYALYLGEVEKFSDGIPEVVILDDSYVLVIHKKPA